MATGRVGVPLRAALAALALAHNRDGVPDAWEREQVEQAVERDR